MAWITPKKDWQAGDIPGAEDFNRIENNTEYCRERQQLFTSSGTFTVPAGVYSVHLTMVGGGAGGAGGRSSGSNSGAGAGGRNGVFVYKSKHNVTPGQVIPVTIGAGGGGGAANSNKTGGPGGTTSFGSIASAAGGNNDSGIGSGFVFLGYGKGGGGGRYTAGTQSTPPSAGPGGSGSAGFCLVEW